MRHIPDGSLRRLVDEPFAVADADSEHVAGCARCARRHEEIARDAAMAGALLTRLQPLPDLDSAWRQLQASERVRSGPEGAAARRLPGRHWRLVVVPVPSRAALTSAAAVLVLGAAGGVAAAIVSSAPTTPVTSSASIEALTDFVGINGGSDILGGFSKPSGTRLLPFGLLRWSSSGVARPVASIAAAEKATGLDVKVPADLPSGVGGPSTILVQPAVTATLQFNATTGSLAGTSLVVTAGPAVVVEYGNTATSLGLPTLVTFVMPRPAVSARDASAAQLEAYVLSRPSVPGGLAQELRLLSGTGTVLPLPASGATVSQVDVGGVSGVLVTDSGLGAAGVLWVDRGNLVHATVGLLDQNDILRVAAELG